MNTYTYHHRIITLPLDCHGLTYVHYSSTEHEVANDDEHARQNLNFDLYTGDY